MNLKENWNLLVGIVLPFLLFISSFYYYPHYIQNESIFSNFGRWVVVIVVGLMLIPMAKWRSKKHVQGWVIATGVFLSIAIFGFFISKYYEQEWTCPCQDKKVELIGSSSDLMPEVRRGVEREIRYQNQNLSEEEIQQRVNQGLNKCSFLLSKNGCQPEKIWTHKSIKNRALLLAGFYVLFLPFFILAMMSVLQAVTPYLNKFINTEKID